MNAACGNLPIIDINHVPKRHHAWTGQIEYRIVDTETLPALYIPNGSRVYQISHATADLLRQLESADRNAQREAVIRIGLDALPFVAEEPPSFMPTSSVSLAVAQKCNLGCSYCYAEGGDFGMSERNMSLETALEAVDFLFEEVQVGERVNLAFLGGEPLMNRAVLRAATHAAMKKSSERNVGVGFSITTNATLVTEEDAEFFDEFGFAVTVSIDGVGQTHDHLRPFKSGRGSYESILPKVKVLISHQNRMQVTARVTVTPENLTLKKTLDQLIAIGFHSVGFSPMLSSPTQNGEMQSDHLEKMLYQMIECGEEFERRLLLGERYPFSNIQTALVEIHKGTHRPYPCGAGAGYLGVSSEGDLFACHRFVGEEDASFGSVTEGRDQNTQNQWLTDRHVHKQEPCNSCWAKYLCGGGCHHEVIHRGRVACEYIRGWLDFCLGCYVRISRAAPDYFQALSK